MNTIIRALLAGAAIAIAATGTARSAGTATSGWVRIPDATLDGDVAVNEHAAEIGLPRNYFDELDRAVTPKFGLIHSDLIQTAIVETTNEVTRSFDFPGDEVVHMRSGRVILIDEPSGRVQIANAGDYFVVPAHWRGLWIFKNDGDKPAREHAMLSAIDYAPSKPPLDRAALPKNTTPPGAMIVDLQEAKAHLKPLNFDRPGTAPRVSGGLQGHIIFAGEPSFIMLASAKGASLRRDALQCESVVRVLTGSLVLEGPGRNSETFGPEDAFVVKRTFNGHIRLSPGFSGLSVTSSGTGTPPLPGKAVATVTTCPAI